MQSAPISELVERMLTVSDNDIAEALAHLAGHAAGDGGSFTGGAAAAMSTLEALDVPTTGFSLSDGSGLARSDRIAPITLARLFAQASTVQPAPVGVVDDGHADRCVQRDFGRAVHGRHRAGRSRDRASQDWDVERREHVGWIRGRCAGPPVGLRPDGR